MVFYIWRLYILVFIPYSVVSLNIGCLDNNCTNCSTGYSYLNTSCLPFCPKGYSLIQNTTCTSNAGKELFYLDFYKYSEFSGRSFKNFKHPSNITFNDSSKQTPVPTKYQGFLFTNTSGLVLNSNLSVAPDFCLSIYIRIYSDGIIFQISKDSMTFLVFSVVQKFFLLELNYTNSSFTDLVNINTTISSTKWIHINCRHYQYQGYTTINANSFVVSFLDLEFRIPVNNLDFIFGSFDNESFFGFIYTSNMRNEINCMGFYFGDRCEYNQYISNDNCVQCFNKDLWPPCIRNNSNICYSENCIDCDGYSIYDCYKCNNRSIEDCINGKNCLTGYGFNCTSCLVGFQLKQFLCVSDQIYDKNVSLDFNNSQSLNKGFFFSGNKKDTYYFLNSPDIDDPIPLINRGLYFNGSNYLKSDPVTLNVSFTIVLWVYSRYYVTYFQKKNLNITSGIFAFATLSNYEESNTVQIYMWYFTSMWRYIVLAIEYSYQMTSIKLSSNSMIFPEFTYNGLAFYDTSSSILIKPESQTMIYKILILPYADDKVLSESTSCSSTPYNSSCLWTSFIDNYYNTYEKIYRPCEDECVYGCKTWGTCSICKNLKCQLCDYFNDDCLDTNNNPCLDGTVLSADFSSCCHPYCSQCFDKFKHTCLKCNDSYRLLGSHCYLRCPTRFSSNSTHCFSEFGINILNIEFKSLFIPTVINPDIRFYSDNSRYFIRYFWV